MVSVKNKLKHTQDLLLQQEEIDLQYVQAHVTLEIKLLGLSLLDQNIVVPSIGSVSESVISFRYFVGKFFTSFFFFVEKDFPTHAIL